MTDPRAILEDLLARYHHWAKNYKIVPDVRDHPMFAEARTSRSFDSTSEIIADELDGDTMHTMDFQIGELPDQPPGRAYRSAIYVLARNCYTGRSVWMSPRLPADPLERGVVVAEARALLTRRLISCGVIQVGGAVGCSCGKIAQLQI